MTVCGGNWNVWPLAHQRNWTATMAVVRAAGRHEEKQNKEGA